jgi:NAD(P)-dependent dehydrogenase (short-subunit alcohol dehydrogenase family)
MSLAQRSVIVFGATGGLGRAVLAGARGQGAAVTGVGTNVPDPESREPGVDYAVVDVLDEASVARFFAGLERPPWAIVNLIGGYTPGQRLVDLDLPILSEQLALNLLSAAVITKHALRAMAGQGGGRLLHTSSRVAVQDGAGGFVYSVSKLGVLRLVEAAAAEALAEQITVNCILPSIIDTPANRASMPTADHERWPKAEQIAAVVCFLMSDDSALISGAAIPVYGAA